jgi:hypothetical protein
MSEFNFNITLKQLSKQYCIVLDYCIELLNKINPKLDNLSMVTSSYDGNDNTVYLLEESEFDEISEITDDACEVLQTAYLTMERISIISNPITLKDLELGDEAIESINKALLPVQKSKIQKFFGDTTLKELANNLYQLLHASDSETEAVSAIIENTSGCFEDEERYAFLLEAEYLNEVRACWDIARNIILAVKAASEEITNSVKPITLKELGVEEGLEEEYSILPTTLKELATLEANCARMKFQESQEVRSYSKINTQEERQTFSFEGLPYSEIKPIAKAKPHPLIKPKKKVKTHIMKYRRGK